MFTHLDAPCSSMLIVFASPARRTSRVIGWLLVLPAAVLLATFTHYPAIATLWTSFFSTPKKNRPAVWVGLDNYHAMAADPVFWTSPTLLTSGPLLVAFLLFQRQFVQSFMRAGIR